ncbi:hypothetical protein V502_04989, partial [Pseudogymnoascus sp. VKM F-4520 (FW-2644)]
MPQDRTGSEHRPSEITVRIPHKDARGIPVLRPQRQRHAYKREQEVERQQMRVRSRMQRRGGRKEVEHIVPREQGGDDEGLADFDPVYAGEDVNAIEEVAEVGAEGGGDHDVGYAEVDEVDDEDGDGCEGGDEEFVAPPDVEEVVADAEEDDGLEGEDGGE